MARVKSEKQINAFIKGLITEVSPLTFPEGASLDEDNFVLNRDGSRSLRYGMDYEVGYVLNNTGFTSSTIESTRIDFYRWDYAGGGENTSLGIVRIYNKLWFLDLMQSNPSANLKNGGSALTITNLANSPCDFAVVNQSLVLVSKDLDTPVLLEYDSDTDTVSQTTYGLFVRDFFGIEDNLLVNERPTTLSAAHKYNLLNQGWSPQIQTICGGNQKFGGTTFRDLNTEISDLTGVTGDSIYSGFLSGLRAMTSGEPIACTFNTLGYYPSNADIWTYGKVAVSTDANYQEYSPNVLVKNSVDATPAPLGSFIIGIYNRGAMRQLLSGTTGLPDDRELGRISTVASYADRIFYSGIISNVLNGDSKSPNYSGFIFFSKTVTNNSVLGDCFQEADPTSDKISDIIDTDGGTISIPEANNIIKLVSLKNSVVVIAENGIWEIYGGDSGFRATDFQLSKVTNVGAISKDNIVVASDTIFYWAKGGIYAIVTDQVSSRLMAQNISISTIQSLYNEIPETSKRFAKSVYDEKENTVRWLYNDTYEGTSFVNNYTKELIFDMTLGAWYKHSLGSIIPTTPNISAYITTPNFISSSVIQNVLVNNVQVQVNGVDVQMTVDATLPRRSSISFLTLFANTNYYFTVSKYQNDSFYDWESVDSTGVAINAYLVTGYELFQDIMRKKQIPYILFYFNRTEDGFTVVNSNEYTLNHASSCLVQSQWNWTDSANSGKWGTEFQAYRLNRNYIPSSTEFDYGDAVIVTKNKLRGSGRCLSLKISNEAGKDLQLLGWAMTMSGNSSV